MRRSAAPSIRTDIKRPRFLTKLLQTSSHNDKENTESSSFITPAVSKEINSVFSTPVVKPQHAINSESVTFRTNDDLLQMLLDDDDSSTVTKETVNFEKEKVESTQNIPVSVPKPLQVFQRPKSSLQPSSPVVVTNENDSKTLSNCLFCIKNDEDASMFNVMWCKRSSKKHKTWEGDGMLIVKSRSAILKDLSGKVLDRGIGYKLKELESLEDGSKFCIGGKECEIQSKVSTEEIMSGNYCKCSIEANEFVALPEKTVRIQKTC